MRLWEASMATDKLTQRRVRRLTESWLRENLGKRRAAREEGGDADRRGLRVRLGKSGVITWVHYRQVAGKQMILVLGRYPELASRWPGSVSTRSAAVHGRGSPASRPLSPTAT